MEFHNLKPRHSDLVNDIAFDFYGKRFATCSCDKTIKVWNQTNGHRTRNDWDGWNATDLPKSHKDSVWRLSWAHPEFGQLLASCSEDGTVCIFEEHESSTPAISDMTSTPLQPFTNSTWMRKTQIKCCGKGVNDVKFSHRSVGLKMAVACADGVLRIYEAPDVFDLTTWEQSIEYLVENTVGGSPPDRSSVGPTASRAGASENETAGGLKDRGVSGAQYTPLSSEHGLTCIAWNDCPFEPARLAVGGYAKKAIVYLLKGHNLIEECVLGDAHGNAVHDIAWAPAMGRSFHMIATASRESTFRIHILKRREDGSLEYTSTQVIENVINPLSVENAPQMAQYNAGPSPGGPNPIKSNNTSQTPASSASIGMNLSGSGSTVSLPSGVGGGGVVHNALSSNVWRVAWNVTGTVLATSAEDGRVSLWRKNFAGVWTNVHSIPYDGEQLKHFYDMP